MSSALGTVLSPVAGDTLTSGAFNPGALANGVMVVGIATYRDVADVTPTVTWNGHTLNLFNNNAFACFSGFRAVKVFYLVNPENASSVITLDYGGTNPNEWAVGAVSFSGVDQTTPLTGLQTMNTGSGGNANFKVTVSGYTDNDAVMAVAACDQGHGTAYTNTSLWAGQSGLGESESLACYAPAGSTTSPISIGFSDVGTDIACTTGFIVKAAGAAPVIPHQSLITTERAALIRAARW